VATNHGTVEGDQPGHGGGHHQQEKLGVVPFPSLSKAGARNRPGERGSGSRAKPETGSDRGRVGRGGGSEPPRSR
jgi:hypothetical protein